MRLPIGPACVLALLAASPAQAQLAADVEVPDALEPWRDWVLHGEEFRVCPLRNGAPPGQAQSHVCAWPGVLSLDVAGGGAEFAQPWTLAAEEWVPLPGSADHWPVDVTAADRARPVVVRGGRPVLRLGPGTHEIAGRLDWTTRPASIAIPREVGLVELSLDGESVVNPEIDAGTLWLGLRPDAAVEEDRLDVVVHRRLSDALPMRLETRVALDVAGQIREVALDGAALAGFAGEALEAALPVQLAADGTLRVQVRPGSWDVRFAAHASEPLATIERGAAVEPWPQDEIWSFEAEPRLRVAALEGGEAVDARRSGVPREWAGLPAYRVAAGESVTIVERSRNDAAEPNRLSLRRDLWLDFDGGGFTARDSVSGRMASRWRLDMAAPYTMTMAAAGGETLLVTTGQEPGLQGVELRARDLALTTTARLPRTGELPVTGYRERFDDVATTLHVGPGYRVLAAPGADRAASVWLERWRLLDVFLVLVVAAAAWRLLGPVTGGVALVALVLTFHEPEAPRWAWLNLLVATALARFAPPGRLAAWCRRYRYLSVAALVLLLVPFAAGQLRTAIFPQLEHGALGRGIAERPPGAQTVTSSGRFEELRRAGPEAPAADAALEEVTVTGARAIRGDLSRYAPGALVQTGPGLPDWTWTRHALGFSGPVDAGQTFRLVVIGPALVTAWRLASVAAALALLWLLVGRPTRLPPGLLRGGGAAGLAAVVITASALPRPGHAQAASEFPSPALLEELKSRLTAPPPCHPACASLGAANVDVTSEALTIELDLALEADVAVPVPSVERGWHVASITVDGARAAWLYRDASRTAWLPLESGVHRVVLSGPLGGVDSLAVPFPLPPRRIAVTASAWDATGVSGGRLRSGALELVRQREADDEGEIAPTVFPPYVEVVRRVELDVDWQVTTTVERVTPASGAFTLDVALLPGEAMLTPDVEVAAGTATAVFAPGEDSVRWRSRLPTSETLTLTAAAGAPWTERWRFAVGHIWHAELSGLPSTLPERFDASFYVPEYRPRPGETLTVRVTRPEAAGGDTIAIDAVDYARDLGARSSRSRLSLRYRSTRGDEHVITLPAASELERVAVDGQPVPLRLDGDRLGLPVTPGRHDAEIVWRNAGGAALSTRLPAVDLGGGATNVQTTLSLPEDRWVLYTFGPTLGSAVLYWPELAAFVLAALLLGRLAWSPLGTHEWLLLGLGLSTFLWPVLLLFAVWAFAMSWRGRAEPSISRRWFNALQVALAVLTVVALGALVAAIPVGLLGRPDMQIVSPVRAGALGWFADRSTGTTPTAGAVSVSLWYYKAVMLAWALWLSFALMRWLPWAWRAFGHGGMWRPPAERASEVGQG